MTEWAGYPARMAALRQQADLIEDVNEVIRYLEGADSADGDIIAQVRQDRVFGERPVEVVPAGTEPYEYGLVNVVAHPSVNTSAVITLNLNELATLVHAGLRYLREHPAPVVDPEVES